MSASETKFEGVQVRYDSAKSYDALVAALLADIGESPVPIDDITTTTGDWQEYEDRIQNHAGPS